MALFVKLPIQAKMAAANESAVLAPEIRDNNTCRQGSSDHLANMAAVPATTPDSHVKLFAVEIQFYALLFPDMRGKILPYLWFRFGK
jgi:hypothetical protein